MKISASILGMKDDFEEHVKKLSETDIDYIHLDIMDGIFVKEKTWTKENICFTKYLNKPLDVHLMVKDVYSYIDAFSLLNPEFITFHYEASNDVDSVIDYIKTKNTKIGISINPDTKVENLLPYLKYIDLVLVMSVIPGKGGQIFQNKSINKIKELKEIKKQNKYKYLIEIDGGINDQNIKSTGADIAVVGSFITESTNYQNQIDKLRKNS
ncbi:MAG: ribulose-phosphate 3-epimerase [Bacilli bacterium]|nr:ribulose-phosphate 3-epimerase [Bacilli bacterium]